MKDLFIKYAYHIDNLREDAGIKTSDFCEGVCEPRTYRMYISGQRIMSQKMLNGFCKKLKLTPKDFYSSYNTNDNDEYKQVERIYIHLIKNEFEKARKILILFDNREFINYQAELLYEYCIIRYNLKTQQIVKAEALNRFSELINYPNCLEKTTFTLQDTLTISSIAELESEINENKALNFLTNFLSSPRIKLSSSYHRDILPSIFSQIAFIQGLNKEYAETLKVAKRGIRYCLDNYSLRELDRLYYYSFLSCLNLDLPQKDFYCKKTITTIYSKFEDKNYHKKMINMLKKDTNHDYIDYILNAIKIDLLK